MKDAKDLERLRDDILSEMKLREENEQIVVSVGLGTCGIHAGAEKVVNIFIDEISSKGVNAVVTQTGCIGHCAHEPLVQVHVPGQEKITYGKIDEERAKKIVDEHLVNNRVLYGYALKE